MCWISPVKLDHQYVTGPRAVGSMEIELPVQLFSYQVLHVCAALICAGEVLQRCCLLLWKALRPGCRKVVIASMAARQD